MSNRLVLLGTKGGPAIRPGGPSPTSTLLELGGRRIVIDCGLGVTRALVEAGMALPMLDMIIITHLHSDHVLEFGPLIHTAWTSGLKQPVTVFGPVGTRSLWDGFLASLAYDIDIRISDEGRPDIRQMVEISEFGEGVLLDDATLRIEALRVEHPPVTECYALKFTGDGQVVAMSADTAFFPPLADFARGADILLHEAMHPAGVDRLVARTGNGARLKRHLIDSHTMAADVGRIAMMAGVGHLVLNHLVPADDTEITAAHWTEEVRTTWSGPLTVGSDGHEISLASAAHRRIAP
ncbi:ribonuclease BN (tRNA processing enzyme) [Hoeflea marina]|uniref:Ribonuclease BN (tRNA processing enzyme) n=1 Tax=Hoeflea marina TaxID=274592 RepID=A0A317PU30_9HYPH|nr:MBL fold metallo-hydrolase [Hoeflea marina]PWW04174.1 ribonuclease BN (tRNA processing enzyme) [Hoeflea marina]